MNKLKPCPFCGSEAELEWHCGYWGISCKECTAEIGDDPMTEEQAIAAWNTRAEPKARKLTLEELREMDGKPVWVKEITEELIDGDYWGIVCIDYSKISPVKYGECVVSLPTKQDRIVGLTLLSDYGKTWEAYDREPVIES